MTIRIEPGTIAAGHTVTYAPQYLGRRAPLIGRYAQYERGTVIFVYHGIASVLWDDGRRVDMHVKDLVPAEPAASAESDE